MAVQELEYVFEHFPYFKNSNNNEVKPEIELYHLVRVLAFVLCGQISHNFSIICERGEGIDNIRYLRNCQAVLLMKVTAMIEHNEPHLEQIKIFF
jgi:hypothetical protein